MPTSERPTVKLVRLARESFAEAKKQLEKDKFYSDLDGALIAEALERAEGLAQFAEQAVRHAREHSGASDDERLAFIREAVLWCRIDTRDDAEAWKQARAVWDAKPEDC